jgi:hypothetical protein
MLFINNWSVYRSLLNIFKRLIIDLRGSSSRRKRGGWGNIDGRSRLEGFCRDTIKNRAWSPYPQLLWLLLSTSSLDQTLS